MQRHSKLFCSSCSFHGLPFFLFCDFLSDVSHFYFWLSLCFTYFLQMTASSPCFKYPIIENSQVFYLSVKFPKPTSYLMSHLDAAQALQIQNLFSETCLFSLNVFLPSKVFSILVKCNIFPDHLVAQVSHPQLHTLITILTNN